MSACLAKSLAPDETAETPVVLVNEGPSTSKPNENAIVPKNLSNIPDISDTDWLEIDPDEKSDNQLIDVLTQIKKSNANLSPTTAECTTSNTSVNSVSNIRCQ